MNELLDRLFRRKSSDIPVQRPDINVITIGQQYDSGKMESWLSAECAANPFQGDLKQAANLMSIFFDGMARVVEKKIEEFPRTQISQYKLRLVDDESVRSVEHDPNLSKILVKRLFLEQASTLSGVVTLETQRGEPVYCGTPQDIFFLIGIEEGLHVFDYARRPRVFILIGDMSLARYDSQPHEFNALKEMILIAKEKNFPEGTIQVLINRWQNVIELQKAQQE